jgi:hypothetical protein
VRNVPRLEFISRAGSSSSFTGEKVTEKDVHLAVARSLGADWAKSPVFTCVPVWDTPPRYVMALEQTSAQDPWRLAETIDAALQSVNIEYAEKRRTSRLAPLSVVLLKPGAFRRIVEHRTSQGTAAAQVKHAWLQRDAALLDVFVELGLEDSTATATRQAAASRQLLTADV